MVFMRVAWSLPGAASKDSFLGEIFKYSAQHARLLEIKEFLKVIEDERADGIILVNPRSQIKIVSTKSDKMGRIITAKLGHTNTPNSVFQIVNLYAPNIVSDRKAFFDTLWLHTFHNILAAILTVYRMCEKISLEATIPLATKVF